MPTVRKIRRILVAIKDPRSASFLPKAAQIAAKCGAELTLYRDLDTPIYIGTGDPQPGIRAAMRNGRRSALASLEQLAAPLRAAGLTVSTLAEWDFPADEAIIRAAVRIRADLIVVHGRTRHRFPALLGYTDWSLLRDSPIPVLLIKTTRPYRRPKVLAAVDPSHNHAKPAGLDAMILREAAALARWLGTAPHVVYAYESPSAAAMQDIAATVTQTIDVQSRGGAQNSLGELLRAHSIPNARRHLVKGSPVEAITRTARDIGAAIVVMGAISRRGLKRLFIGDTAERLLDQLACDLLVIKPARFAPRLARARRGAHFVLAAASIA